MSLYAHSSKPDRGIPSQTYDDHIRHAFGRAWELLENIKYSSLKKAILLSILYHDLGKLDDHNQKILSTDSKDKLPISHEDAGSGHCLNVYEKTKDISYLYAAFFIHCHHTGLQDKPWQSKTETRFSIIPKMMPINLRNMNYNDLVNDITFQYVDYTLPTLLHKQHSILSDLDTIVANIPDDEVQGHPTALDFRMAFSIFIDADHSDTARFEGYEKATPPLLKSKERAKLLDEKVTELNSKGSRKKVNGSRKKLYDACTRFKIANNKFISCDAPTGSGKTLATMKLALRVADKHCRDKIFFIVPYTNIINQTVDEYRNKVVLPGEDTERTINEIHSKVEYNNSSLRKYSHQWNSPINVSTSIQFFETLFSCIPSQLRKMHQFINSVVVLDEYHTAMPHRLWCVALESMKELSEKYNITFIFSSGTPVEYWDIFQSPLEVKSISAIWLKKYMAEYEKKRRNYESVPSVENCNDHQLIKFIQQKAFRKGKLKNHTLIVCNTIMNSILITRRLSEKYPDVKVLHLSTGIAPVDRDIILKRIHKLTENNDDPIILVATSIVECGIDFKNFKIGFREKCSINSLIQFGGRINRNREYRKGTIYTWSFDQEWISQSDFTTNPRLRTETEISSDFIPETSECTDVVRHIIERNDSALVARYSRDAWTSSNLVTLEKSLSFKTINTAFDIIENRQVNVIVNSNIIHRMKMGYYLPSTVINRNSVPVYKHKIERRNHDGSVTDGPWRNFINEVNINGGVVYHWVGNYTPTTGIYAQIVGEPEQPMPF